MEKTISFASLGIDVGKDYLDCCLRFFCPTSVSSRIKATRKFKNTFSGHKELVAWVAKHNKNNFRLLVILEATGCYYENIAFYLHEQGFELSVVLPKNSKYFAKASNIKSKTDEIDAKMLSLLGEEKFTSIMRWTPPSKTYRELRKLTRFRLQLIKQRSMVLNQIHAEKHSFKPDSFILEEKEAFVLTIEEQISKVETRIKSVVASDSDLQSRLEAVCTIPGVGFVTGATVIAETFGFQLIENNRQLVSYAGYDVVEQSSGKRKGKPSISKKGNSKIRAALHFGSLSAVRHEENFTAFYTRIFQKNPQVKMIGYVAVQRKLLVLIRTLFVKNENYDETFGRETTIVENEKKVA